MTESLERMTRRTLVLTLLALSGLAWYVTVRNAGSMSDMAMGLGQVGTRMENDLGVPLFISMWVAMMVAMMFPTIAPLVLAHRMVTSRRQEGAVTTAVLIVGYLLAWTVAGAVPLAALLGFRAIAGEGAVWVRMVAGGVIAVAGAYQFTRWKAACLKACRSPMGFLATHDFGGGARSALRAGVSHGLYCLGCCWALMSVLVVVGMMNLAWMGVLALIFLAEKTWRHGVGLTKIAGAALIALGIAVLIDPGILPTLSGGAPMMSGTGMGIG
jgi:predicted metal-binding membrane protein